MEMRKKKIIIKIFNIKNEENGNYRENNDIIYNNINKE